MPAKVAPLTAVEVRNAAPKGKLYRIFDGGGLYLEIPPTGARYWRLKYRFAGAERRIGFGVYPEVSLAEARERREKARALLRASIDPGADRKASARAKRDAAANSFEAVAREWLGKRAGELKPVTLTKMTALLETWAFPWIGSRPIRDITPRDLLELVLRRVEGAGKLETVHRLKQRCGQVFRYAIATGLADRDPTPDLRGALSTPKTRNRSAITEPTRIGQLLRDLDSYHGLFPTRCALRLAPLVFVRPGELRAAEWSEIDLDRATWTIPGARMKMGAPHVVPLSTQAVAILRELEPFTGARGRFLFPGLRTRHRPMSDAALNVALRTLGYSGDEMTAHGFRAMASTLLNEQGWDPDVIERQLAHKERNEVRAAYNRAQHLQERRRMMQAWADHLDELRKGADVVPLRRTA